MDRSDMGLQINIQHCMGFCMTRNILVKNMDNGIILLLTQRNIWVQKH